MGTLPRFQVLQYEFAAHIRDPGKNPAPAGISDRRMAVYRELLFNNTAGLLGKSFPVIRLVLGAEAWAELVRDYFARHIAGTPYFTKVPEEFLAFLADERNQTNDPPWLAELAHYEWAELAVAVADVALPAAVAADSATLVGGILVVNPAILVAAYRYPVHRIRPGYQPDAPAGQPVFLVVRRNRQDEVGFLEISPVSARLLELLRDRPTSLTDAVARLADELPGQSANELMAPAITAVTSLLDHEVLLGVDPHSPKTP